MRPAPRRWVRGAFAFACASWLSASPVPCEAHDLWILPGSFQLSVNEVSRLFLNNGDVFPESLTLTTEARLAEVELFDAAGSRPVSAFRAEGRSLTFDLSSSAAGTLLVGVALEPRRVRLRASDFEDYLSLEGLSAIAALREALGESEEAAFEQYTKWAKTIVRVEGDELDAHDGWREPIGHRFEIVPRVDPASLVVNGVFEVAVLFEGEPRADVPIVAGHAAGQTRAFEGVTGPQGAAAIPLTAAGRWYVRALHMERREDDPEVKWESFWCTLTFEVEPMSP